MVERGFGDHVALIGNGRRRTYKELADWSNRLAHALVENYGVRPGNRVLIRSGNNPAFVAAWLAATKAGAVVVNTMPMLRAGELAKIVDKAEITLALTDSRIADELVACAKDEPLPEAGRRRSTARTTTTRSSIASRSTSRCGFDAVPTARDDVALLGFTSGTTGEPKATMHFHRDLLIIADGYAQGGARRHARRCVRRLAAARLHLRSRRPGDLPAALRRHGDAARERLAGEHDRDHRDLQGHDLLHGAHGLSRDDGRHGRGRRPVVAAAGGLGRRDAARAGVPRLGGEDRHAHPRRHRHHRAAAHLHHQPRRRRASRAAPAPSSPATRPASSTTTCARCRAGRWPARGARADGLPLSGRRAADEPTCATAGT